MAGLKLVPVDDGFPTLEIQGERATVGRTAGVDHVVNDPSVSRQHAVFELRSGVWTVTDKGSVNGTFVDGQRIASAEVRDGQEVRFGGRAFRVKIEWGELPTAMLPPEALPPRPRPAGPTAPPPRAPAPPVAPVVAPPLPPRPIPPRPIPPRPAAPAPPPPAMEEALPPTVPPQRGPMIPPRPQSARPPRPGPRGSPPVGLWREANVLVAAQGARLPDRCVKCGVASEVRLRRKLSWHHPLLYLLIPVGLLVYVIVAAVASKRAALEVPLCESHKKRRLLLLAVGLSLLFLGIVTVIGAVVRDAGALVAVGLLLFLVGMIVAIVGQNLLTAKRIDDHFSWLRGVDESVLSGLPPWPGPVPALAGLAASGGVPAEAAPSAPGPTGMAQAALVAGVLSIFLCPAPLAIVLGILGILDVRRAPGRTGLGRSIFGLAAGLVGSAALGAVLVSGMLTEARRASSTPRGLPKSPRVVITGKSGRPRIAAPAGWRSEKELNAQADLQACDPPQQVCVIVIRDEKATVGASLTLAGFSRYTRGQILKKLQNPRESAETALQIAGHEALQYELRGRTERIDLVYLHTSVETPEHFYQILGWTSAGQFPAERTALRDIAASFQP